VDTGAVEIETRFAGFDDYWEPFLRGTGPARRSSRRSNRRRATNCVSACVGACGLARTEGSIFERAHGPCAESVRASALS
jgi:hypothetical protein